MKMLFGKKKKEPTKNLGNFLAVSKKMMTPNGDRLPLLLSTERDRNSPWGFMREPAASMAHDPILNYSGIGAKCGHLTPKKVNDRYPILSRKWNGCTGVSNGLFLPSRLVVDHGKATSHESGKKITVNYLFRPFSVVYPRKED